MGYFYAFIIIFNTSINSNSIIDICNSVNKYLPNCGVSDYISTLNWSLKYEIELVTKIWNKENYISFYILAFFLANTPLIYLFIDQKRTVDFHTVLFLSQE